MGWSNTVGSRRTRFEAVDGPLFVHLKGVVRVRQTGEAAGVAAMI